MYRVEYLVLDESDKLFELGFVEQIDSVVKACSNPSIIRSLFSATLPDSVEELARSIMHDAVRVIVGRKWVISLKFILSSNSVLQVTHKYCWMWVEIPLQNWLSKSWFLLEVKKESFLLYGKALHRCANYLILQILLTSYSD